MTILERLNQVNDIPVLSVTDPEFASYGRVVTGYDFSGLISYMEEKTQIPRTEIFIMRLCRKWRQIR